MVNFDTLSILTIAFLGSFGHCIGMCGGIVIAYSTTKVDDTFSKIYQILSHMSYNFGRITTYLTLGLIFGYLGSIATLNNTTTGFLYLFAGTFMVLSGLSVLGKIKFLTVIEHSISSARWYKKAFSYLLKNRNLPSFYALGILNGFLPCGFVYFFAIIAASTGSAVDGASIMALFGIATLPAMFSLGYFIGVLKQQSFRNTLMKIAGFAVIAYGFLTLYNGYLFFTDPLMSLQKCH